MAISVALKLSADGGNLLGFGADQGLYASSPMARGGPNGYTLDNSTVTPAAGATFYYWLPFQTLTSYTWLANTAQVSPLVVSRDCRIVEAGMQVSTAGAGSQIFQALFASDPSSGMVAAKVADLLRFDSTATGFRQATVLNPSTVLNAGRLYWTATWVNTTAAYPATVNRSGVSMHWSLRMAERPQVAGFFGNAVQSQSETAQAWSGLSAAPVSISPTPTPGASAPTTTLTTAPHISYGLLNV